MKVWTNTKTLDQKIPEFREPSSPEEAEVAVIGSKPIDLDQFPRLRGLFKCGVGTDNVPFDACEQRGIKIGLPSQETAQIIYEETASFTVATILRMLYMDAGDLDAWTKVQRPMLNRRNVLVIGMGRIGSRVADKLAPLLSVSCFDIGSKSIDELWPMLNRADAVSLHIPLSQETYAWFGRECLAAMQDEAVLVNTARGAIVDEGALLNEVETGRIRAAFDVFWEEPYYGCLREFHPDRFFMTPHVASTCVDFLDGLARDCRSFVDSVSRL